MGTALGAIPLSGLDELPDIELVEPLSDEDAACIAEIREVLTRHGALGRFGLTLLHQHFPLASDEVLVEVTDPDTRTLIIRPRSEEEVKGLTLIQTHWRLDTSEALVGCAQTCAYTPRGHVKSGHLPDD